MHAKAATRLQPALRALAGLRQALDAGSLSGAQVWANELGECLLDIEDCVGVSTPASLFELEPAPVLSTADVVELLNRLAARNHADRLEPGEVWAFTEAEVREYRAWCAHMELTEGEKSAAVWLAEAADLT